MQVIKKQLSLIARGSAQEIKIGQPFTLSDHELSETLPSGWGSHQSFAVPVTIKLKEEYLSELRSTLDKMATEHSSSVITPKYMCGEGCAADNARIEFKERLYKKLGQKKLSEGSFITLYSNSNGTWTRKSYFIPEISSRFKTTYDFRDDLMFQHRKLLVSFNNKSNISAIQADFNITEGVHGGTSYSSVKGNLMIRGDTSRAPQQDHPYQLSSGGLWYGEIDIYPELRFFVIAKLTPEQLSKLQRLSVEFKQ